MGAAGGLHLLCLHLLALLRLLGLRRSRRLLVTCSLIQRWAGTKRPAFSRDTLSLRNQNVIHFVVFSRILTSPAIRTPEPAPRRPLLRLSVVCSSVFMFFHVTLTTGTASNLDFHVSANGETKFGYSDVRLRSARPAEVSAASDDVAAEAPLLRSLPIGPPREHPFGRRRVCSGQRAERCAGRTADGNAVCWERTGCLLPERHLDPSRWPPPSPGG